jgi:hypothetical protein
VIHLSDVLIFLSMALAAILLTYLAVRSLDNDD